jgi:hypothetical protein
MSPLTHTMWSGSAESLLYALILPALQTDCLFFIKGHTLPLLFYSLGKYTPKVTRISVQNSYNLNETGCRFVTTSEMSGWCIQILNIHLQKSVSVGRRSLLLCKALCNISRETLFWDLRYETGTIARRHQVSSTSASFSGNPVFISRPVRKLSWGIFRIPSVLLRKWQDGASN